ncbi:UNVERIFIED_CONTAM: hypothetical protein FKN15_037164 [Acipenser sinensis]
MPRKKKSAAQSPARTPVNSSDSSTSTGNDVALPSREPDNMGSSNFQTSRSGKEEILSSMLEMFSHLDSEVIYMVLSECDFKAEVAMDILLELSNAAEGAVVPAPLSGFESAAALLGQSKHDGSGAESRRKQNPPTKGSVFVSVNETKSTDSFGTHLTEDFDSLIEYEFETIFKKPHHSDLPSSASSSSNELPELIKSSLCNYSTDDQHISTEEQPADNTQHHGNLNLAVLAGQIPSQPDQASSGGSMLTDFSYLIKEVESDKPPLSFSNDVTSVAFKGSKYNSNPFSMKSKTVSRYADNNGAFGGFPFTDTPHHEHRINGNSSTNEQIHFKLPNTDNNIQTALGNGNDCNIWPSEIHLPGPHMFITPVAMSPVWRSGLNLRPSGRAAPHLNSAAFTPASWGGQHGTQPVSSPMRPPLQGSAKRTVLVGKVLVLLRGAPGSGKSTLARNLLEQNPTGVILSTDDYFLCDGHYQYDRSALGEAHEWTQKRAKETFKQGLSPIIIDNTNIQGWEMKPYVALALQYNYKVMFREPDTWWKYKPRELERQLNREKMCSLHKNRKDKMKGQPEVGLEKPADGVSVKTDFSVGLEDCTRQLTVEGGNSDCRTAMEAGTNKPMPEQSKQIIGEDTTLKDRLEAEAQCALSDIAETREGPGSLDPSLLLECPSGESEGESTEVVEHPTENQASSTLSSRPAQMPTVESPTKQPSQKSLGSLNIQSLELCLPPELAFQLSDLFGPVGIDPDPLLSNDYQLDRLKGSWGGASVPGADGAFGQWESSEGMPFMDHWSAQAPHVSLKAIMSEEMALQEQYKKAKVNPVLGRKDGAAMLKEKQLFDTFPSIDRHFLMDIFRDNNGEGCTHLDARRFGARRYTRRRLDARCTRLDARCSHLDARRFGASTLGARTSTLDASALDATRVDASTLGARVSTLGAHTSTLDASVHRRSVHAPRRSTLRRSTLHASTPRRSVHAPRRSTLRCIDARCTHLDARRFCARRYTRRRLDARCTHLDARRLGARRLDARCSNLDARRFGASTLGARTSTLDASALDATRVDASMLGARTSTLRRIDARCTHLDARRFGASTLGARTSTLDASAHRRSVHAPRRSTLRRIDARCTHLDARRFGASTLGARTSTLDASAHRRSVHASRRSVLTPRAAMSGFHRCVTCQAKLPASDPHEDCVACLGPEHAASALADRSFCALCANFQPRTLRQRARKAVGQHSPSSGSSFTLSVPPSSTVTAVTLRGSRSPSQLTAGQRSPDRRHSPSVRSPSVRRERSRRSQSRSLSPRRRGRSRSPRRDRRCRDKSGVAELTSKMSQFMEVMMGQQSLLMSLTNRAPPAEPVASHSAFQPQPLAVPVVQQPQGVWDIDAISRDASEGDPLLEEDSPGTDLASQHSEHDSESEALDTSDPLWSLVERATRHLGIEWQAVELPRRSLFESPSVRSPMPRTLPAFPDFIKEVQSTWGAPASSPATSRKASAFAMQGASEAGLASFPPVDAAFAALVKTPTLSGLVKDPACPNKQCRTTEIHLKKGYLAATEAVKLSNVASLLTVYQRKPRLQVRGGGGGAGRSS